MTGCREFTINMISNWFLEAANYCSGNFEAGDDELDMCGLTAMPSTKVSSCLACSYRALHIQADTLPGGIA